MWKAADIATLFSLVHAMHLASAAARLWEGVNASRAFVAPHCLHVHSAFRRIMNLSSKGLHALHARSEAGAFHWLP